MFMRFVELRVQPDLMADFERFYQERIATALRETEGCLFAGLLYNQDHPSECVSMTLWRSPGDVEAYESGGLYQTLLEEVDPYLWHSTEWRVRLSDDLTLQYEQVSEPPVVQAFPVEADSAHGEAIDHASSNMYLRVLSGKVKPGQIGALAERYENVIVPALLASDGCRYAYLVRGNVDSDEILSVTLWDSKVKADAYERHGRFRELVNEVQPMMVSVLHWQMMLDSSQSTRQKSTEDYQIEGYQVVTCDSFEESSGAGAVQV